MSAFDVRNILSMAGEPGRGDAGDPVRAEAPRPVSILQSPIVLAGIVRTLEGVSLAVIGGGVLVARGDLRPASALAVLAASLLAVGLFQALGLYRLGALRDARSAVPRLLAGWCLALAALAGMLTLVGAANGRGPAVLGGFLPGFFLPGFFLPGFFLLGGGGLLVWRLLLAWSVAARMRQGLFERRTAIVGGGAVGEELIRALEAQGPESGVRVVGVFDDRADARSAESIAGYPKLGSVADLVDYARHNRLELIIVTIPVTAEQRILEMLAKLWVLPVDIRLSAHAAKLRLRPRSYSYIGRVPVLDVFDKPIADWDVVVKGLFDRLVGLGLLALAAPVMLAVALAVRLTSSGPVLFRQVRHGFNNEPIEVLKFRSMYTELCDPNVVRQVTRGDTRVTPVGRFIRKTSLDELPQLFNVLRGDLSLVGPRPHVVHGRTANAHYDQVVDGYFARHRVKPGITGWAQINGWRGETDTSEKIQRRVEHDLYYIENWSVLLDLKILLMTPVALIRGQNAY